MGSGGAKIRRTAEYVSSVASLVLCDHLFSFLCLSIHSASSASLYLALYVSFPHPPAPGLCRMQTEGASGVEVQLILGFGPPLGPSPTQRIVFEPFGTVILSFRSCCDGNFRADVTVIFKLIFERLFGAATHRRRPRDFKL